MKERPILMSAPMVRAILDGTKAQTRRIVRGAPSRVFWNQIVMNGNGWWCDEHGRPVRCPYGQPGDRLWVRETWQAFFDDEVPADRPRGPRHTMGIPARPDRKSFVFYKADGPGPVHPDGYAAQWCPSIHMPRKYSRITLEITDVRVERLQEISEADAIAEGVDRFPGCTRDDDTAAFSRIGPVDFDSYPIARYAALWESINGAGSWDKNPWVWVMEFRTT